MNNYINLELSKSLKRLKIENSKFKKVIEN